MADYYVDLQGNVTKNKKKRKQADYHVSLDGTVTKNFQEPKITVSDGVNKKTVSSTLQKEKDSRAWFQKGAFEDGYQFGDITKTLLGTATDIVQDAGIGILDMGEKAIDAGAYVVGGLVGADKFQKDTKDFVAKDLYDSEAIIKKDSPLAQGFIPLVLKAMGTNAEKESVLGDKSDALAQSAGQLGTTIGLQAAGVPWWVTTGVTSFGGETENAFNEGATYTEAGLSGTITAGADILTELLSGGIKFGGKALDDIWLKPLTQKISNKAVKTLVNLGVDASGEGFEEVASNIISNLGTTIYKEESVEELLTSEEALDGYIESFIGGAVLGGSSGAVKAVQSAKTGRDYNTGLTENEQKVVDSEIANRVAKAEVDGAKLTLKEKNAIEKRVRKDLEKGYIGIDIIESTLGGKTYEEYKSYNDKKKALEDEIETFRKMPMSEFTVADSERLRNARKELIDLKKNTDEKQLKERLSKEVSDMTLRDAYLQESYNEKRRRSQSYETDLSKYEAKQQATIQKAIDSGILNNTNRTHEFVDMIAKISADKGVLFDFTDNKRLKESGFVLEGAIVNGYVKDGNITLNINSAKALNSVVGHEITHVLEGTEHYAALQEAVFEYAKTKKDYDGRLKTLTELYKDMENADINKELTADLIGDYLFTDEKFVQQLSTQNRNVFQKIYDEIKYLVKTVTSGSKEAKQLEKVKKLFDDAYKETNTQKYNADNKRVQYDISEDTELYQYIQNALDGKVSQKSYYEITDAIPKRLASDIEKIVGFSVEGYGNKISPNHIQHISDRHGAEGKADQSMKDMHDLAKIGFVIENYDNIRAGEQNYQYRNKDNSYAKTVVLQKKIDDGFYYVVEAVPDAKAKTLYVVSAYQNKNDTFSEEGVQKALNPNVQNELQFNASSNISIPQGQRNTTEKQKNSLSKDSDGNQLSEMQVEYFKDSQVRDERGALKVVYHGTNAEFTVFDNMKQGTNYGETSQGFFFFTNKKKNYPNSALDYAETTTKSKGGSAKVYECYLKIEKPLRLDSRGYYDTVSYFDVNSEEIYEKFFNGNYDGVIIENSDKASDDGILYLVDNSARIKSINNQNPTSNQDITLSLSENNNIAPIGNWKVQGSDLTLEGVPIRQDIAPAQQQDAAGDDIAPWTGEDDLSKDVLSQAEEKQNKKEKFSRKEFHKGIIDRISKKFEENGFDFDAVLQKAKDKSTFSSVDNTPQRFMEKTLGYKEGQILSDLTVNQTAQNETNAIRWLNSYTDRKNGFLAQISKQYGIKPKSKESAAAQMYGEGFYVNKAGDLVKYGDAELAKDFPDPKVQKNIKQLAKDPRIRQVYDDTLQLINESRARNGYPEIPKRKDYFLHFRAMEDTFSRLGLPFNPNDIKAKDLPTDINGVTADLKPGQPYFASAQRRMGNRTTYDLLGGLERYLGSAKNQIYHIDDIQTLRALRNYIADTYGQAKGLESLDDMSEEEAAQRIEQVYDAHLSTFAKFLNEQANTLAGKTSLIDRGLEGIIGRKGITFLDTVNKQVGSNMVGMNISSSLTNLVSVVQGFAKVNKYDFTKAFAQTVANKISSIKGKSIDNFTEENPLVVRRKGSEKFTRTPYETIKDAGYIFAGAIDDFSTEVITRAKYNELTRKGMDSYKAHIEADKWASRILGDRSYGQQPQLYNSKMLGLLTKFQLEVRNQLDSMFYDTIQEAKYTNEEIQNGFGKNAKIAAKVGSTFLQLAIGQHIFGQVFESVAGYNPTFDIIEILTTALGFDDEEESEDTVLDNLEQGFLALVEDLPYTSTFTGGRIPIASALPIEELITGKDQYGNEKSRLETLGEALPYYILPTGYGQGKKTLQGLKMFDDDLPVAGSYTDSGKLRFPVEETPANVAQAAVFGQYASKNARDYFENNRSPLKDKQLEEFLESKLPIKEYWDYREGLKGKTKLEEKADYIAGLDIPIDAKNLLINNQTERENPIDLTDYDKYGTFEELDYAVKHPERYTISKAFSNYKVFEKYRKAVGKIEGNKDENGKPISDSKKQKILNYIKGLEISQGEKMILFKQEYTPDNRYNSEIIDYLSNRNDISHKDKIAILKELGFTVESDGTVRW